MTEVDDDRRVAVVLGDRTDSSGIEMTRSENVSNVVPRMMATSRGNTPENRSFHTPIPPSAGGESTVWGIGVGRILNPTDVEIAVTAAVNDSEDCQILPGIPERKMKE